MDLGNNPYPARIIFPKCRSDEFTLLLKAKQQTGIIPWRVMEILVPSMPLHGLGPAFTLALVGYTHTLAHTGCAKCVLLLPRPGPNHLQFLLNLPISLPVTVS